jgi:5,10-methenyltetrahydromethanopterin hydrogenase
MPENVKILVDGVVKSTSSETTGAELHRLAGYPEKLMSNGKAVSNDTAEVVKVENEQEFKATFTSAAPTDSLNDTSAVARDMATKKEGAAKPKGSAGKTADDSKVVKTPTGAGAHDKSTPKASSKK